MTTKHSSYAVLKGQADAIARILKKAERGEPIPTMFASIRDARKKAEVTAGVVMDDKIIKLTIAWDVIKVTEERALSEFILREMQERRDDA